MAVVDLLVVGEAVAEGVVGSSPVLSFILKKEGEYSRNKKRPYKNKYAIM